MTIKERVVEVYQGHGFNFFDACEAATEWLAALKKEPPGTQWTLGPNAKGQSVTVRRD